MNFDTSSVNDNLMIGFSHLLWWMYVFVAYWEITWFADDLFNIILMFPVDYNPYGMDWYLSLNTKE